MARVALIDGDSFAYRLAAAVEKTRYLILNPEHDGYNPVEFATHKEAVAAASRMEGDTAIWNTKKAGTLKDAVELLEHKIERSITRAQCTVFHVFVGSPNPTFRDHLARIRKYKGTRPWGGGPEHLGALKSYLVNQWGGVVASGEEADDMLSYTARELTAEGQNTPVVIGNDKDLNQIPGEHYDWVSDKLYSISDAEARIRMWVQVLHGDVGDNVAGCWQVGAAKAERTIREAIEDWGLADGDLWKFVCQAYEESQERAGCPYVNLDPVDVALENYHLVRLRQSRHEKHNYMGLFVREKEKKRSASIAEEVGTSTSTSGRGDPSACAASERKSSGRNPEVQESVREDNSTGLAEEESSL